MRLRSRGIFLVILSAVIFGLMPFITQVIYDNGGSTIELVFLRNFLPLPVLALLLKLQGGSFRLERHLHKPMLLLSIGWTMTPILQFLSYLYIPASMSTTLHFVYPAFVLLGCVVFCHERSSPIKLFCVVMSIVGIVLFYTPGGSVSLTGVVLAFLSGVSYAFYIVYLKFSGLQLLSSMTVMFWVAFLTSVETFIISIATRSLTLSMTTTGWLATVSLAVSITVIGCVAFQSGLKIVGPQQASILSTFEPITSVVVGVLLFSEPFSAKTVIGSILILASVILLAIFEKENAN